MKQPIIEEYEEIKVVREDCFSIGEGSPPFSKMRGLVAHMKLLKSQGVSVVGYVESNISMAGWGVAFVAKEFNMKAVIFNPTYTKDIYPGNDVHAFHKQKWEELGAEIVPFKAGMVKVNFYKGRSYLREHYGEKAVLLPLGLPFNETIVETAYVLNSISPYYKTIVLAIGSGTICAGLLSALPSDKKLIGVLTRSGNLDQKRKKIISKAGVIDGFDISPDQFVLVDPGWDYSDKSVYPVPFPSHDYYDRKAWEWLHINKLFIKYPLFWNIGRNI